MRRDCTCAETARPGETEASGSKKYCKTQRKAEAALDKRKSLFFFLPRVRGHPLASACHGLELKLWEPGKKWGKMKSRVMGGTASPEPRSCCTGRKCYQDAAKATKERRIIHYLWEKRHKSTNEGEMPTASQCHMPIQGCPALRASEKPRQALFPLDLIT